MNKLEVTLSTLVAEFVGGIQNAVLSATLEEVQSLGLPQARTVAPSAQGPGSPNVKTRRKPKIWGIRVEDYLDRLVELVKGQPYGVRGGILQDELGIGKTPFLRVAKVALAQKRIKRTGTRGGLYYFGQLKKIP
jgi:hypothetical protein